MRLTEKNGDGYIPRMGLRHNGYSRCTNKLAAYEDTGLGPEEIRELLGKIGCDEDGYFCLECGEQF